jgi:hypothetical protein
MTKPDYDALLAERRLDPAAIARRRDAEALAETARNLASLEQLREAAEKAAAEGGGKPPEGGV